MILKDHIKVSLIQPIEPCTKRNRTGNRERIFILGNWFLIQIRIFPFSITSLSLKQQSMRIKHSSGWQSMLISMTYLDLTGGPWPTPIMKSNSKCFDQSKSISLAGGIKNDESGRNTQHWPDALRYHQ